MRVRDLGVLVVAHETVERRLSGTRAAAVLARLVVGANRRVSADALMEAAWGEDVRAGSPSTLETHVWRLRQLLEPGRARREAPSVIVSESGGFRLVGSARTVDSLAFPELANEVGDLLLAGRPSAALTTADRALALWRGRPWEPFADRGWARPAVAALDELHEQVRERRVEALIALGATDRALTDLESLVPELPFRERLWALRMLGLHRSGRTEDALRTYQRARRTLLDGVGTEPGHALQRMHQQILDNDPALVAETHTAGARTGEVHLPGPLAPLVGRGEERRGLVALLVAHRLITVVGAAGCGKTRVAVEVARDAAERFPDGVWFVDLAAVSRPDLVVDVVASTIGFAASAAMTPLENLRTYVRSRRVLLLLDNCEHVLPAVARVVELTVGDADGSVECAVLATSREPIAVPGEVTWTLGPLALTADDVTASPSAAPAVELFMQRLTAAIPTLRVDDEVLARAAAICAALDGLPLPLELAAARVRSYSLDEVLAQVTADPGRLGRTGERHGDHRATVRAAIEWSHRMVSPPERIAHRRLSVLPGPVTTGAAAAVIGDQAGGDVEDLLAQLVHRSLLSAEPPRRRGAPTTFRQLATVRAHAARALVEAGEAEEMSRRRDEWTVALLGARPRLGSTAEVDWYHALDDNYATVRATLTESLIDRPTAVGGRLAPHLAFYWYYRGSPAEGERWLQLAREVLVGGDFVDQTLAELALGSGLAVQGRIDEARSHLRDALARLPRTPAHRLVEIGEALVGAATACWVPEDTELVVALSDQLSSVARSADDAHLTILDEAVSCVAAFATGQPAAAARQAEDVHLRAVAAGNLMAQWVSAGPPAIAALLRGDPSEGVRWVDRLIRAHVPLGLGAGGSFIETRANCVALTGNYAEAATLYGAAHTQTRRAAMTWPRRPLTHQLLGRTREYLSRADYERAWQQGEQLTLGDVAAP